MDKKLIRSIVNEVCNPHDYEFGFAILKGLIKNDYSQFGYGISLLRKLDDEIIDQLNNGPTIEYYEYYHTINSELDTKVKAIALNLEKKGIEAIGIKATSTDYELDKNLRDLLQAKVSHKMIATCSGLGWIGKSSLLISKRFGPRVRLASVLINEPVEPDFLPIDASMCGNCNICVNACPAAAINGVLWNTKINREAFLDVFNCKDKCRELSKTRINKEISLCGICLSVCPGRNSNKSM